jgi:S-adenosylmethionine:diacylglycerol 3-amino-3-carboxypropyl transferase
MMTTAETPWQRGRFDARRGPSKVLFGRMYEDSEIERGAFAHGGRVFCIASAGCMALQLARDHEVVAVDINPVQLEYARQRIAGAPAVRGTAERVMGLGRALAPLVGWSHARVREFLDLAEPDDQIAFWRDHLDTRRFRTTLDGLLSLTALRRVYASPFLAFLPPHLGAVMRARMERGFAQHPNRENPYARALLLGELAETTTVDARSIQLVRADAADFLERAPAASFTGFTLSNILDGADDGYRRRLFAAVKHAAAPDAVVVLRSFGEPPAADTDNRAAADRAMIWGMVRVGPAATFA